MTHRKLRIIPLLLLAISLTSTAQRSTQTRRTTTTKSRATVSRTARPQTSAPKTVRPKTIVAYEVRTKSIACYAGHILYAEDNNNNPLVQINGETGKGIYRIKGKANIYENVRSTIDNVFIFPAHIVLKASKPMKPYRFLIWNGESELDESNEIEGWESIKGSNGKYAFIVNKQDGYELWDVEELKPLYKWKPYNTMMPEYGDYSGPLYIASDMNVWYLKGDDVQTGPVYLNVKEGKFYNCPLANEEYVKKNDVRRFGVMRKVDDYLYVACERRIYRMNMLSPGKWEEFLRIPPTEDNEFDNFYITPNGNILAIGKRVELYRSGEYDKPQLLGTDRKIKTGLTPYSHQEIWLNLSRIRVDDNGNFIIFKDNTIYVYNPDGLVGFTDTYGQVINYRP